MTGGDVEVVCGEWEIGEKPYRTSGEDYNLVLNIQVRFSKVLCSVILLNWSFYKKKGGKQNEQTQWGGGCNFK